MSDNFTSTKEEALKLRRELRRKIGKKHHVTKCIGGYVIWPYYSELNSIFKHAQSPLSNKEERPINE